MMIKWGKEKSDMWSLENPIHSIVNVTNSFWTIAQLTVGVEYTDYFSAEG